MVKKLVFVLALIFALSVSVTAQDGPPPMPEIDGDIILEGLTSPQGLHVDSAGTLWVADSGLAGEETIEFINPNSMQIQEATFAENGRILRQTEDGEFETVVTLPSVNVGEDFISVARMLELDGNLYFSMGAWHVSQGEEVTVPGFGTLSTLVDGEVETVADTWAHELENDPDQSTNVESHPYGLAAGPDGMIYMADAAANTLLRIDPESGEIETVTAFDPLPGVFPGQFYNGELLTDPVPTAVVVDEDGTAYVSLLSGAPFIPGSAGVMAVSEDGEVTPFAPGLTMLTDLTMGPDGNLYATQFGMFTQEGPVFNSGAVIRILEDGTPEVVVAGLPFVTALAIDAEGNGYVAINGAGIPNAGMIVRYDGLTEMEGAPLEMPEM